MFLNVHAQTWEKSDDSRDSFYEELDQVFYHLTYYRIKFLLGDFYAKVGIHKLFKPTIGNEKHQDTNNNAVRIVNLATKNSGGLEHYVPVPKHS